MSSLLKEYLDQRVMVVTVDGETHYGELTGFDKQGNLVILDDKKNILVIRSSEVVLCGQVEVGQQLPNTSDAVRLPRCKAKLSVQQEVEIWAKRWAK
ncbi:hypothetical protein C6P41_004191 [Kluyveromyces marxianus]|nr:hypothetical protein C6P41_004191 [Kluyveromyces marxianus]